MQALWPDIDTTLSVQPCPDSWRQILDRKHPLYGFCLDPPASESQPPTSFAASGLAIVKSKITLARRRPERLAMAAPDAAAIPPVRWHFSVQIHSSINVFLSRVPFEHHLTQKTGPRRSGIKD